jgi:hypothetical protein
LRKKRESQHDNVVVAWVTGGFPVGRPKPILRESVIASSKANDGLGATTDFFATAGSREHVLVAVVVVVVVFDHN